MQYSNDQDDIISTASTVAAAASKASSLIKSSKFSSNNTTSSDISVSSNSQSKVISQGIVSASEKTEDGERINIKDQSDFEQIQEETFESGQSEKTTSIKKKSGGAKNKLTYKGEDLSAYSNSNATTQSLENVNVKVVDSGLSVGESMLVGYAEAPGNFMRKGLERFSRKVSESFTVSSDEAIYAKEIHIVPYEKKGDVLGKPMTTKFEVISGISFDFTQRSYDDTTKEFDIEQDMKTTIEFSANLLSDKNPQFENWIEKSREKDGTKYNDPLKGAEEFWPCAIDIIFVSGQGKPVSLLKFTLSDITSITSTMSSSAASTQHFKNFQITGVLRIDGVDYEQGYKDRIGSSDLPKEQFFKDGLQDEKYSVKDKTTKGGSDPMKYGLQDKQYNVRNMQGEGDIISNDDAIL